LQCEDDFEPDNDIGSVNILQPYITSRHSICPSIDYDWFKFTLKGQAPVSLDALTVDAPGDLEIQLYDGSMKEVDIINTDDGEAQIDWEGIPAGDYYMVVLSADSKKPVPGYDIRLDYECAPVCQNKVCGEDGCGGTCGTCGEGRECFEGICVESCIDEFEPDDGPGYALSLVVDEAKKRSICPATDTDWFNFSLDSLSSIKVWATTKAQLSVEMHLYDNTMTELDSATSDNGYALLVEKDIAAGDYFLSVESSDKGMKVPMYSLLLEHMCTPNCNDRECGDDGCGGTCGACGDLETCNPDGLCLSTCVDDMEPDDESTSANFLNNLVPQQHSVCPAEDRDWYKFTVSYGSSVVRLETSGLAGDTEMWLYDAEMNEVGYDDDSGVNDFSLIEKADLVAGVYFAEIRSLDSSEQIAQYTVFVKMTCTPDCGNKECGSDGCGGTCGSCEYGNVCSPEGMCKSKCVDKFEPDDSSESSNFLVEGVPMTHSICPSTDSDWYSITISQTSDVNVEAVTGQVGVDLLLYDSQLGEIGFGIPDDDGVTVIEHEDLAEGIYFVEVLSSDDELQVPWYTIKMVAE